MKDVFISLPLVDDDFVPPWKTNQGWSQVSSRLNSDFNIVTSLIQVFVQVFYVVLVGVIWLFVKWCWNFGTWLESQKWDRCIGKVVVVVVDIYIYLYNSIIVLWVSTTWFHCSKIPAFLLNGWQCDMWLINRQCIVCLAKLCTPRLRGTNEMMPQSPLSLKKTGILE